jgi:hypothetical protein
MKKIYIEPRTKIKEQAELLLEMKGIHKGSKNYESELHKLIDERIKYSSIPHASNPRTPKLNQKLWNEFEFISNKDFFKNAVDQEVFKSAVTSLTNLYLKNVLGLKTKAESDMVEDTSDFDWPKVKDLSPDAKKEIAINILQNRYTRLLIACMIIDSLIPVFMINKSDIEKFYKAAFGETINDLKTLMDKKTYSIFTKSVQQNIRKMIKQKSLIQKLFEYQPTDSN